MTHKMICYDNEGGLDCACALRAGQWGRCPHCQTELQHISNGLNLHYCLDCGRMQPVTPPNAVA